MFNLHKFLETRSVFLLIGVLLTVSIGGLVEIAPLFYLGSTDRKGRGDAPLHVRSNWPAGTSISARGATTATRR